MISASQMKLMRSLGQKKYRERSLLYLVEGDKMVKDLLKGSHPGIHQAHRIYATPAWIRENEGWLRGSTAEVTEAHENELKKVSFLVTPQPVIALVSKPRQGPSVQEPSERPVLVFESIRDPGNLGTILRTASWFGIDRVVCSPDSVDLFNPKVVQATMGAIFRIRVQYIEPVEWISSGMVPASAIYGTFLEGDPIYGVPFGPNPVFLFGNESTGLSDRYDRFITRKITIPAAYPEGGPESLNVAASVAVVCSEWRRRGSAPTQSGS